MYFTREPIIESVLTTRSGHKLVVRSTQLSQGVEYRVDALEIVSFPGGLFYRHIEGSKPFFVPASDYEIFEVKESRLSLKVASSAEEKEKPARKKKRTRGGRKKESATREGEPLETEGSDEDEALDSSSTPEDQQELIESFPEREGQHSKPSKGADVEELEGEETKEDPSEGSREGRESRGRSRRGRRSPRRGKNSREKETTPIEGLQENVETSVSGDPVSSATSEDLGERSKQLLEEEKRESFSSMLIPPPKGLVSEILSYEKLEPKPSELGDSTPTSLPSMEST